MLTITDLSFKQDQRTIIEVEHADINASQMVAILGPNGAGKSSLLKLLASELPTCTGDIHFYGKTLSLWDRQQRARHIGVLPQASQLNFPFTAKEVVAIGTTPLSLTRAQQAQRCQQWMKKTDTWQFADRLYTNLSGGERQRVQLARVLVQLSEAEQPPLLLLDEPTSAQDLGHQHEMLALLKDLSHQQQFAIITILHDINQAYRYADKVWLLHQGKMQTAGTPAEILTPQTVERVWGYLPEQLTRSNGESVLI